MGGSIQEGESQVSPVLSISRDDENEWNSAKGEILPPFSPQELRD